MKRYVFKKYLCYINKLYDTRISSMLTPGVGMPDIRVSVRLTPGCRATNSCSMLFPALLFIIFIFPME